MRAFCVLTVLISAAVSSANPLQYFVNNEAQNVLTPLVQVHSVDTSKSVKEASAGLPRRLGVGKRHQWADDETTMAPHMKSVIGKAKKESKGTSKNEERGGGKGKRARPVMDEVEDVEEERDNDGKLNETTNSTSNKKSKDKKSESSSDDKQKQKDKLSKPTPTPTPYPTSVESDSPSAVPSTVKINPGVRPVFDEPTISPVNSTSLLTDAPVVVPVMVLDAPVATPVTVTTSLPLVTPVNTTVPIAATMQTSSPTGAPNINIIAAAEQVLFTDTIKTRSLYLRVAGEFDPVKEEGAFFTVLEETFNPYCRAYISYILNEFKIAVSFLNALTQVTTQANESSIVTSWCEVNVTFQLASDNEEDVAGFTMDRASQFVKRFFMDTHKTRLINLMAETGVSVSDLEVLEELPAELITVLSGSGPDKAEQDERAPPAVEVEAEESDLSKASYGVAIASGGVIFLALGAMALMHRQQKDRVSNIHGRPALISGGVDGPNANNGKTLAFVSGNRRVDVKPAALQVRNRREREGRRQRAMSSNNTVSTYFTTETALSNTTQADTPGSYEKVTLSDKISGAGARLADLAVSSALTCLDGEESVGALNEAYPEFEMYQSNGSPPPSPVWSIDQYSNASPYSVEEDYVAERRRWHDEANELSLIALPDTNSVYSMSQHSRSSESHNEEHNKRHRMDEV